MLPTVSVSRDFIESVEQVKKLTRPVDKEEVEPKVKEFRPHLLVSWTCQSACIVSGADTEWSVLRLDVDDRG